MICAILVVAQVAGCITPGFVVEVGDDGLPLSPPAVMARARTRFPNSTTATKLLLLVPYVRTNERSGVRS